ncbi:MAG: hypothetical protein LYZ70_00840 [Nitrososphaerales archaeon]|nr:hypothetical protein [Nitrososphaerales archaeon]
MLPFANSFAAIVAAMVFPSFVSLLIVAGLTKVVKARYLAAFALGIYFWFFSDTIGDSAYLDVNAGFTGGPTQVALFALFAVGLLLVFSLDRDVFKPSEGNSKQSLAIPLLLAFAIGIHGFGEGAAFSSTAAATSSTNLFDAFGGPSSAVAFLLHKALEPMMIGVAYWIYARGRGKKIASLIQDALLLTFVFTLPGIIGSATDYFLNYDTTYLFAFGLGTSLYAPLRLAKPLYSEAGAPQSDSVWFAICALLGFASLYVAALLHA